jgi:hypothetical protein
MFEKVLFAAFTGALPHISQCFAIILFPFLASILLLTLFIISKKSFFASGLLKMVNNFIFAKKNPAKFAGRILNSTLTT